MGYAKTSANGDASRKAFEQIFAEEIVRIIIVLQGTGDLQTARDVQSEALSVLDSSMIRSTIEKYKIEQDGGGNGG
jgi:hypothetical protein